MEVLLRPPGHGHQAKFVLLVAGALVELAGQE
jgi:hypothetical protein